MFTSTIGYVNISLEIWGDVYKRQEFMMAPTEECDDNWRWAEQWLPHACWYLNAMGWKLKRVK